MSFPWGVHERQGVTYVEVPVYEPSQASITLGAPQLYKPSRKAETVRIGLGLDAKTIALIAIPVGLFLFWLWKKK